MQHEENIYKKYENACTADLLLVLSAQTARKYIALAKRKEENITKAMKLNKKNRYVYYIFAASKGHHEQEGTKNYPNPVMTAESPPLFALHHHH